MSRAAVTRLDGKPLMRDADGTIHGEPLNITAEERARLPKLEPLGDGPVEHAFATYQPPEE